MGIVDYFRLPKRSWYWYRNEYAKVAPPQWPVAGNAVRLQLIASKYDKIKMMVLMMYNLRYSYLMQMVVS